MSYCLIHRTSKFAANTNNLRLRMYALHPSQHISAMSGSLVESRTRDQF